MEILQYEFMQRAFIAGGLLAVTSSVLGVFMVLRREAMIGHGLSHATFAGVALGLLMGYEPMLLALLVAVIGAVFMIRLKEDSGLGGDTGIGILSSIGMALGVVIATIAGDFNADLLSYLFGSILTIQPHEVIISGLLAAFTICLFCWFYQDLIYVTFDKECAKASGISAHRLELILGIITAVTVVVGMRIVGLLLVTALMVIPGASALLISKSVKSAILLSVLIGVTTVILGLVVSYYLNFPASGSIVILEAMVLGGVLVEHNYSRTG